MPSPDAVVPAGLEKRITRLLVWGRTTAIWSGFGFLILFGILFLVRDALKYLDWSEVVYRRFWPQRAALLAHILTRANPAVRTCASSAARCGKNRR